MKILQVLLFWASLGQVIAQVTFNGVGNLPVPPGAPAQTVGITQSTCSVSGIGTIGGCVSIANVTMDLTHTFVGDIGILLIGPGGQVLELSTSNGGAGDNYTNTVFSDNAANFITTGSPPYTGTFRPEGRVQNLNNPYSNTPPLGTFTFANTYNGTNADGDWILYINDYVSVDVGVLNSWSITFDTDGSPPIANAGNDVTICDGGSTTLTASGGDTYEWDTGAATSSISVSPSSTTTYMVTVSQGTCGTDTDEVTVTVNDKPSVTLSSDATEICGGQCKDVEASFVGMAPFTLNGQVLLNGSPVSTFNQVFTDNSGTFSICIPVGMNSGSLTVQATSLTDAFCICN